MSSYSFVPLTVILFLFLIILPSLEANLVDEICFETEFQELCASTLYSDPHSATADVYGLTSVAINLAITNASDTWAYIPTLIGNTDPALKKPLEDSEKIYDNVVDVLYKADTALIQHEYLLLKAIATDVRQLTGVTCDRLFPEPSKTPLTDRNLVVVCLMDALKLLSTLFH